MLRFPGTSMFVFSLITGKKYENMYHESAQGLQRERRDRECGDWPVLGRRPMINVGVCLQCLCCLLLASPLMCHAEYSYAVTACNCVTLIKGRHGHSRHFFCLLTNVYGFHPFRLKAEAWKVWNPGFLIHFELNLQSLCHSNNGRYCNNLTDLSRNDFT